MEKSSGQIVTETVILAVILTVISFFNGGVRYDSPEFDAYFWPVWLQLLRNYIIYFVVFLSGEFLFRKLKRKK